MSSRMIWYRCITHSEESFYRFLSVDDDFDLWMVERVARNYHDEHDGWEANWPLTFSLHETEGGPEIARFEVQRETEPVFYAAEVAIDREAK